MFLSRFCNPNQNQRTADRRYALHDHTETPAACRPTHIVRTWGTVMSRVKLDMPPRRRRSKFSEPAPAAVIMGSGAMVTSWTSVSQQFWDCSENNVSLSASPASSRLRFENQIDRCLRRAAETGEAA